MNIFVARLNPSTTSEVLQSHFEKIGGVSSVKVVFDKMTGESRCFAFVEMPNDDQAQEAITSLNDTIVDSKQIVVKKADPREGGADRRTVGGFSKGDRNRGGGHDRNGRGGGYGDHRGAGDPY
jgi:RNA recognition motif-containing protein